MKLFLCRALSGLLFSFLCVALVVPSLAVHDNLSVSAKSAILVEGDSGSVIWSKNCDERLSMASTTKIMTALVALENYSDLQNTVAIHDDACGIEGSSIYLKPGETLTMMQLLEALLLSSANDAATAIAIEVAGSVEGFSVLMNETALRLGMTDSHFTNPHGLDDELHYTTAADMAKLAVAAMKNENFAKIVSTYKATIPMDGGEGTRVLLNHNKLLKYYDGAVGIKTGFTKRSGRCLVSAAEKNGVLMIAVTLSAPDDWNDHRAMLDFGFSKYTRLSVANEGSVDHVIPVTGGAVNFVRITNKDPVSITVPVDHPEVRTVIEAPRFIFAPVTEGRILGYARCFMGNDEIACIPLYADTGCERLPEPILKDRLLDFFKF